MKISNLKKIYFRSVEQFTPEGIKKSPLIDLKNKSEFHLILNKQNIQKWQLKEWLKNYKKEAQVSTGGIRGAQNILYYWDHRFPIHQLGVTLATIGKALVLQKRIKNRLIHKIAAGEVRYNTKEYVELISRVQAGLGIHTHLPFNRETIPVWMVSFLIFMLDYDGGEYVTSSHAISSKIATKDLNDLGSQFLPEDSLEFVREIEKMLQKAEKNNQSYTIKIAPYENQLISDDFNGYDLYTKYLRTVVARQSNLNIIKQAKANGFKVMFELVGGCMYKILFQIYQRLGILEVVDWRHKKEDPFFHGVGKIVRYNSETRKKEFFDLSCDACLLEVVETMGFEKALQNKKIGYTVLITDPDGDRLVIGQVESYNRICKLQELGINYIKINKKKIFAVYHPTYTFLPLMDFQMKMLKKAGLWNQHSRVMITTTASAYSWIEWAQHNGVKVVLTPVGFKELAVVMRKIEKQLVENPGKQVVVKDIWGKKVNLGRQPRLFFAGEESGGMISGPEQLIKSKKQRMAIAMHEKSAGEASIGAIALAAKLFLEKKLFSEYLEEIFVKNNIKFRYYVRDDITYYNESEPDPVKLKKTKACGEVRRDKTDLFYLALALALREKRISIEQARSILSDILKDLDFSRLQDIIFVGDAVFFSFTDMFVEVRKSGTDAKMRGYACGVDKKQCEVYLEQLLHYDGRITKSYNKLIPLNFRKQAEQKGKKIYDEYLRQGL